MGFRRRSCVLALLVSIVVVMSAVASASATATYKNFNASSYPIHGYVVIDGRVEYSTNDAQFTINRVVINSAAGWACFCMEAALFVEVLVWINNQLIWWWMSPTGADWMAFATPLTGIPPVPKIWGGVIGQTNIIVDQGGTLAQRTGYKLEVEVYIQLTGWFDVNGPDIYGPMVPIPFTPITSTWRWSIGAVVPPKDGGGDVPI